MSQTWEILFFFDMAAIVIICQFKKELNKIQEIVFDEKGANHKGYEGI